MNNPVKNKYAEILFLPEAYQKYNDHNFNRIIEFYRVSDETIYIPVNLKHNTGTLISMNKINF